MLSLSAVSTAYSVYSVSLFTAKRMKNKKHHIVCNGKTSRTQSIQYDARFRREFEYFSLLLNREIIINDCEAALSDDNTVSSYGALHEKKRVHT